MLVAARTSLELFKSEMGATSDEDTQTQTKASVKQVLGQLKNVLPGDLCGQTSNLIQHLRSRSPKGKIRAKGGMDGALGMREIQQALAPTVPDTLPVLCQQTAPLATLPKRSVPVDIGQPRRLQQPEKLHTARMCPMPKWMDIIRWPS